MVPLLPIPNRTVKRLCADDSAGSRVKVGHCQAIKSGKRPAEMLGVLLCAQAKRPVRNAGAFSLPKKKGMGRLAGRAVEDAIAIGAPGVSHRQA